MAKELNTRIQLKHGLAAKWTERNPVLLAGEVGIETDTLKMKVGDGTTNWKALGYLGADANDILAIINKNRDSCTIVEVAKGQSDTEALATISNPKNGDIAILEKSISGDKKSHTAFVYDNAWKAMDGNYNASNVYFDKDLTYTVGIGTLAQPSGSSTFSAAGKSVEKVFSELMAKEANPTTTQPSATLSSDNIGAMEVGTNIAIKYNISTNPGSYTYGPETGVTFSEYKATFNGETLTGASGTFTSVQVTDTMSLSISGSVKHSDGVIPKTNLGNAYEEGQIKAATKSLSKGTLTGYRNWFYGYKAGGATIDAANLTSANIRALTPRNGSFPETISTNKMQQMFFAIPKGNRTDVSVANNVNGAPCTVTKVTDIMVEGANGYTAIAYDVWYVNNAAPDGGSNTYKITVK